MRILIGLVGEKRGGKGTFVKYFRRLCGENQSAYHRFSEILSETLDLWGLENTRSNLQNLSIAMKNTFGDGTLMRAVKARMQKEKAGVVLLDGVRWKDDEALIRSFTRETGWFNRLIYVTADPEVRWKRGLLDAEKADEAKMTFDEFMTAELKETETYIPEIGSRADIRMDNNGNEKEFFEKIKRVYEAFSPLLQARE